MKWQIELTATAAEQLTKIKDKRIQKAIGRTISKLEENPELQGKALVGPLAGYRSVRSVGQRYRIVYRVFEERVVVTVVSMGIRKEGNKIDIYNQAQLLLKKGLLEPEKPEPGKEIK